MLKDKLQVHESILKPVRALYSFTSEVSDFGCRLVHVIYGQEWPLCLGLILQSLVVSSDLLSKQYLHEPSSHLFLADHAVSIQGA